LIVTQRAKIQTDPLPERPAQATERARSLRQTKLRAFAVPRLSAFFILAVFAANRLPHTLFAEHTRQFPEYPVSES
jgi:hypothetical protein